MWQWSKVGELDASRFSPGRIRFQLFVGNDIYGWVYRKRGGLTVEGRENIPAEGSLIICGNHRSFLDPPILTSATQRHMLFMAKKELWENKFFGGLLDALGAIPINREKPELATLRFIKQVMKTGWSMGMFIEGTRSKIPGQMGPPQKGCAYFAKATNSPILPVGIIGSDDKTKKLLVRIGKPIMPGPDLDAVTWQVMEALSALTGDKLPPREPVLNQEPKA
ncbi:MAG: 1-acyl-sn-glycerol-3-phosphate acyltransferase [Candidatus Melainabacteria bacterium]|jgi:1-acyl-sn-glycerol-3-phosphate acyltransferase|nr:1-acyl-sn-glycerol-3-phosphate acyltransferase [Candidatus Melainabacteria bacterium]MBX9673036.1 1-acyl-sn-glycerol-3-phosphate acyltransferase [Candidatus Obscuribacterales bacterium]